MVLWTLKNPNISKSNISFFITSLTNEHFKFTLIEIIRIFSTHLQTQLFGIAVVKTSINPLHCTLYNIDIDIDMSCFVKYLNVNAFYNSVHQTKWTEIN